MRKKSRSYKSKNVSWKSRKVLATELSNNEAAARVLDEELKKGGFESTESELSCGGYKLKASIEAVLYDFKTDSSQFAWEPSGSISDSIFTLITQFRASEVRASDLRKKLKDIKSEIVRIREHLGYFTFSRNGGFVNNKYLLRRNLKLQNDETDSDGFAFQNAKSLNNYYQINHYEQRRQTVFYR